MREACSFLAPDQLERLKGKSALGVIILDTRPAGEV
jgi:hypothetical protein